MAKQVLDIKSTKGIAAADSKEQTRSWTEKQMELRMANKDLNYDFTRTHLNFEIVDGEVKEVNKKELLDDSIRNNLKRRGIPFPGEGESHVKKGKKKPEKMVRNIAARIILGGSTERMNQIAFGNQIVNFTKGSDNSRVIRMEDIEKWAKQEYAFLEKTFGKGSVARFIVHLDEGWVHGHATIIPTAIIKGRERVSWRSVFGGSLDVSRPKWKHIIDEHYNQVGKNWGLDRGDPVAITGAKHRSTSDHNKELKAENSRLKTENENLSREYADLVEKYENLAKKVDDAHQNLSNIVTATEQLTDEMGKHMKAMKSLTSMIENRMIQRGDAVQVLQQAQTQRDSGQITLDQYDIIVSETNKKMDEFDKFIKGKADSLTNVGIQLIEKQSQLNQLQSEFDTLFTEVDAAKKFKKENDGLFKRLSSYIENRTTEWAFLDVAKRLNAIPDGEKVEGLSELANVLKTFADGYPEQISHMKMSGYKLGYNARNEEIEEDINRLRSAVSNLGATQSQNMNLAALISWLEEMARQREKFLNLAKEKGYKNGRNEAVDEFISATGLKWKNQPTPSSLGKRYGEMWHENKRLADFEKNSGSLSEVSKTIKQHNDKIDILHSLMPTLDDAIKAIISLFHNSSRDISFTMKQTEDIWRILSMAGNKKECDSLANKLVELAREEDGNKAPEGWINDAKQCVQEIADNVNPLAAIFNLLPTNISVGGGGSNNDLPRKKDDEDFRNKFHAIMTSGRNKKKKGYSC